MDHVYAMAGDGYAMVTVRFKVGEDQERSVTKVQAKLAGAMDQAPPGALPPLVKPHSIDDVPMLALTLHSARVRRERAAPGRRASRGRDPHRPRRRRDLRGRRAAAAVPRDARSGAPRGERRHAGRGGDGAAGRQRAARGRRASRRRTRSTASTSARRSSTPAEVGSVVVGVRGGAPVYLRNVADVTDGFGETTTYVSHRGRGGRAGARGDDRGRQAQRRERDGGDARRARARGRGAGAPAAARRARST